MADNASAVDHELEKQMSMFLHCDALHLEWFIPVVII